VLIVFRNLHVFLGVMDFYAQLHICFEQCTCTNYCYLFTRFAIHLASTYKVLCFLKRVQTKGALSLL